VEAPRREANGCRAWVGRPTGKRKDAEAVGKVENGGDWAKDKGGCWAGRERPQMGRGSGDGWDEGCFECICY
jgi:hypothetical protein